MIYEIVWWVVVSFGFLQELCKIAKIKKRLIGEFMKNGQTHHNPPHQCGNVKQKQMLALSRQKPNKKGLFYEI